MHMQVQLADLQQSGLGCFTGSGVGSVAAVGPTWLIPLASWHGFSTAALSAAGTLLTGAALDICMRVAAKAPVALFSTKATLRSTRKRIDQTDMTQL